MAVERAAIKYTRHKNEITQQNIKQSIRERRLFTKRKSVKDRY